MTCDVSGSKLSPGPYRLTGSRYTALNPYCFRTVGLRLNQQHLLRDAVRRVGLLRIASPQVVFAKRYGREFRVGADRADGDKFLDAGEPGVLHQERAHHQILIVELAGMFPVRTDAPNDGRKVDDDVRTVHVVETLDLFFMDQVEIAAADDDHTLRRRTAFEKVPHDGGAEEPGAARDDNGLIGKVDSHSPFVIGYWLFVIELGDWSFAIGPNRSITNSSMQ